MPVDESEMRRRWQQLCRAVAAQAPPAAVDAVFRLLVTTYTGPERHYHGNNHIHDCLRELDAVAAQAHDAHALAAAIWFHDLVYDGTRSDNEERSADLADAQLQRLHVSDELRREVRRLILLTRHDRDPAGDDNDGQLMVDIDLASLALPAEQFDRNTALIRREYPHVPDDVFRRGRCALLERFLSRRRIYFTATFFDRFEQPARQNLQRALAQMCRGLAE